MAVEEEEEETELSGAGRNWKSARRRSAHLLAEQTTVVERWWSLEGLGGWNKGVSVGVHSPMLMCLKDSILGVL